MYNIEALQELKLILQKKYPGGIKKMILFGSRAENREREYSDHDLLLIINKPFNSEFEEEVLGITYDIILKYDIMADLKFIFSGDLNSIEGSLPFVRSALEKGIAI